MALSLSHVQAAASGHNPAAGSGPLTLHVLHKTDALLAQLQALDQTKSHTVHVLKGQANGRAEVQVGALKLDVKSSLPLKAGDVFPAKFEQIGVALRFVQVLAPDGGGVAQGGKGGPSSQNSSLHHPLAAPRQGEGQAAARIGGASVGQGVQSHSSVGQGLPGGGAQAAHLNGVNLQGQNKSAIGPQITSGSALPASTEGQANALKAGATGEAPALQGGAVKAPALTGKTQGGAQAILQTQTGAPVGAPQAALSVSPHLATQITTTALLRAVAEVLPEVSKRQDAKSTSQSTLLKNSAQAKEGGLHGRAGSLGTGALMLGSLPKAETVNASYKMQPQGAIEEVQEIKVMAQRSPDLNLELPLSEGQRPATISLYLDADPQTPDQEEDEKGYGVRFTLETEATGVVYAEMSLRGEVVRLGLWAERVDIADKINEALPVLENRLLATGFIVGGIVVRHAVPSELAGDDAFELRDGDGLEHLDQEI